MRRLVRTDLSAGAGSNSVGNDGRAGEDILMARDAARAMARTPGSDIGGSPAQPIFEASRNGRNQNMIAAMTISASAANRKITPSSMSASISAPPA